MATKKQLPFGQITPVAKPLGAFIQPGKQQTAGAASPPGMPNPSGIVTLQMGSAGSVKGYNKWEQLSQALGPFTNNLIRAGSSAYQDYAQRNIKAGEEEAYNAVKNQTAKAALSLQIQAEKGAADASAQINELKTKDPVAALLLEEVNPWKLVGRRRALARLAAGEINDAFENDLTNNAGLLSALKPGSPELEQRRVTIAQQVTSRYGLTGDEPEYHYYVIPELNKAWDKYRQKHDTWYREELAINTQHATVASIATKIQDLQENGFPHPDDGRKITIGDPEFVPIGSAILTAEIDKSLSVLAGKAKINTLEAIKREIFGGFQSNPGVQSLIENIRLGSAGDDYATRPTVADSMPVKLLDMKNEGLQGRQTNYDLNQKQAEQGLDFLWDSEGGPGDFEVGSEGYKAALKTFRERGQELGYRDIDKYIEDRNRSAESFAEIISNPLELQQLEDEIYTLPPSAFSAENIKETYALIDRIAMSQPTPELQREKREELKRVAREREKFLGKLPQGTENLIQKELAFDLADPDIEELMPDKSNFAQLMQATGGNLLGAVSLSGNQKLVEFGNELQNVYKQIADDAASDWFEKNPEASVIPQAEAWKLIRNAISEFRKTDEYKNFKNRALGISETTDGSVPVNEPIPNKQTSPPPERIFPGPRELSKGIEEPLGRLSSSTLTNSEIKSYRMMPIMSSIWLYEELKKVQEGKNISSQLEDLAKRAKVHPDRVLLEQLRFWKNDNGESLFDPTGEVGKFLQNRIKVRKENEAAAAAEIRIRKIRNLNLNQASNLGAAGWVANVLFGGAAHASEGPPAGADVLVGTNEQRFLAAYNLAKSLGALYPEVVAAQFVKESNFGRKPSGTHNYFGLKALPGGGTKVLTEEDDPITGKASKVKDEFLNFKTPEDSFKYVINRWHKDWKGYTGVESGGSMVRVTELLQEQGYSTDKGYAKALQVLVGEYSNLTAPIVTTRRRR